VSKALVQTIVQEEVAKIRATLGDEADARYRVADATALFEQVALADSFEEFLTLPAYGILER
jgi:malate synthase